MAHCKKHPLDTINHNYTSYSTLPSGIWFTSMTRLVTRQKQNFQPSECQACWLQTCHTSGLLIQLLLTLRHTYTQRKTPIRKHLQLHTVHKDEHILTVDGLCIGRRWFALVQSVKALYSRQNCLKVAKNINASECNALTILSLYECKYWLLLSK